VREPGWAIGREIASGERAEAELDSFISRRHEQRRKSEPEREAKAAWVAAENLQEAARRRENRARRYGWHAHRAELYGRLSREHAAAAEGLTEETDDRRSA
jgi:hypothetical protein